MDLRDGEEFTIATARGADPDLQLHTAPDRFPDQL